jgi:hypothetical protein
MKSTLLALLLSAAFGQASASAVFSNYADWARGVSSVTTVGFEGIAPANSYVFQGSAATIGGLRFSGSNTYVIGGNYSEGGGLFSMGTGAVLFGYQPGITTTFSQPYNAFSLNLRGYNESSTPFTITLSNGEVFSMAASNPDGAFFGVLLDASVSSFKVGTTSSYIAMDNIAFANRTNDVPEPASLALACLGLAGIAAARKRNKA